MQLFGGNAEHMAEAARQVVDWVQPDFIDLNFGCPVNKVVAKNGGSALLKDCATLGKVVDAVVRAVAPLPVTAKIRTGWDEQTINAVAVARHVEIVRRGRARGAWPDAGARILRRGGLERDRAKWRRRFRFPVIGNGDLSPRPTSRGGARETGIAGAMIGRAAMSSPWIFSQTKHYLATGELLPPPEPAEKWALIQRHCELAVEEWGNEDVAMRSMRGRLMAYTKGMPASKDAPRKVLARPLVRRQIDGNRRTAPIWQPASKRP